MNGARGVGDIRRWYQPVPPRPSLEGLLACSWSARPYGWHRLVPDACIDVLWLSTGDIWMCGPEETAWFFQLPSGVVAAGVRFRPGVLPSLIGFHAHTVLNRRVRWRALVGDDNERALLRRLAAADCDTSRMLVLENEVATLAATGGCLDPLAEAVLAMVTQHPRARAAEVAAAMSITTRQLHRRCLSSFGYSVSTLSRIVRFHRFWSIAELAAPGTPLAAVAHDAGYSDHAHLVRDCRAITGAPPGRFLSESFATFPDMSDPYKTGPRFTATLAS